MERVEEKLYQKIVQNVPLLCVDVIILDKNKILLVKRKDEPAKGEWFVPGGRVYKNETLEKAVIRKALEETGLRVRVIRKLGVYEFFSKTSRFEGISSHTVDIAFLTEPLPNQKIKLDASSSDFKWAEKIEDDLPEFIKKILAGTRIFK